MEEANSIMDNNTGGGLSAKEPLYDSNEQAATAYWHWGWTTAMNLKSNLVVQKDPFRVVLLTTIPVIIMICVFFAVSKQNDIQSIVVLCENTAWKEAHLILLIKT